LARVAAIVNHQRDPKQAQHTSGQAVMDTPADNEQLRPCGRSEHSHKPHHAPAGQWFRGARGALGVVSPQDVAPKPQAESIGKTGSPFQRVTASLPGGHFGRREA
jgi:hypothetical protein